MTSPGGLSWNLHGNDTLSAVLEKLDKTLTALGKKFDSVSDDAKRMGDSIGRTETPAKRLGSTARDTEDRLEGLRGKLRTVAEHARSFGTIFAAAAVVAGGAIAKMAVETAASNEQAAISFEILLGNAQAAAKFLSELQKFAAATPFEMPQLRDAASRLLAVGISAERIIPILTSLGDATAGMGTGAEGIQRAVYALQQMSQAGKVSLEDINQLTDAGIPALDALSAKLGKTVSQIRDDISAGKIKPEQLFQAIEQRAGASQQRLKGMMDKQSTTLSGIWSTFKDNAGQALAKFAEPMIPAIEKGLNFAATAVPKVLSKIQEGGSRIKEIFKDSDLPDNLKQAWKTFVDDLLPQAKEAWESIFKTISDNKEGLEKFGRLLVFIAPYMSDFVGNGLKVAVAVFNDMVVVIAHVVDAIKFMANEFLRAVRLIIDTSVVLYGWVPGLGDKLKEAQRQFEDFSKEVRGALAKLDGTTVTIKVGTQLYGSGVAAQMAARGEYDRPGRAAGGPVWPGQVYTWREQGEERLMSTSSGMYVQSNQDMRSASGRGGSPEVLGVLKVVHETPDGRVMREELLALKRERGLLTLGLA